MTDDAVEPDLDSKMSPENDASLKPPQKMGPAFYAAFALVGVLVLLILVINVPGIRASAGITLTQSTWTLQSYADETGALVPALNGTMVTARFGADGRMSGSSGCNEYAATFTTGNFGITISPPATTLMYCENLTVMQQESDYLNDLTKVVELRISESNLNLYDISGKTLLVFENSQ